ncbi:uncharacterized protein LOC134290604 [Aedes albopictus]|uniref:Reverse transcriptase domain-containing protein n=1 Tax=Aedes albopictus TaxID=7160 RepID=A0ABM1Z1Q8_AEDAL
MGAVQAIRNKYGPNGELLLRRFQRTATNLAKDNNRMKFLLNCRRCKVIPKCLNYKIHIQLGSGRSREELDKLMFKQKIRILSVMVADVKRSIAELQKNKAHLFGKIETAFEREDVVAVKKMVEKKSRSVHEESKRRGERKIERLKNQRIAEMNIEEEWVENTTDTRIPDFLQRTLSLGPNFNVQNKIKMPYVEIVAGIEKGIRFKENADEIRGEVASAITNHINYVRQPRHGKLEWIEKDIAASRRFLEENPSLLITKADKGNKTVIIEAEEYHAKMMELLNDEDTYRKLRADPSNRIMRKINAKVDGWLDQKCIEKSEHRKMKISSCNPPRIYGLPKLHKEGRPLRPVVSTIGSATYQMAQYLAGVLENVVGKPEHHVKTSFEFAQQITGMQIPEEHMLFSLDVKSLYTNVPVQYAMECIEARWSEVARYTKIDKRSFLDATRLGLDSTFFNYRGVTYTQTFGVPMGSPLSPVIANIVMERLEQESIQRTKGRYLDFISESPYSHKRNTAIALVDRAIKLTDAQHRPSAISTVKEMLKCNNYPNCFIQNVLKQRVHKHYNELQNDKEVDETKYIPTPYVPCLSEKLQKILKEQGITLAVKAKSKLKNEIFAKLKDPIPPGQHKNVVYSVPCGTGDGKVYIGQTGRKLDTRINEHKNDVKRKDNRTGLTHHTLCDGHVFNFDETKIIERIADQESRVVAETFHIKLAGEANTVNLQRECGLFNMNYNALVFKLRQKTNNDRRRRGNERGRAPQPQSTLLDSGT